MEPGEGDKHDGTWPGLLGFIEEKFPKPSNKASIGTVNKTNATNVPLIVDALQRRMELLSVKERVDQPVYERLAFG